MAASACFCGCGRTVALRLRRVNRQGRGTAKVQSRLIDDALPLLADHRTDHRMLRYVERTQALAREGERHVGELQAIVHGDAPVRSVSGRADWQRTARETSETIILNAEMAARDRERGF